MNPLAISDAAAHVPPVVRGNHAPALTDSVGEVRHQLRHVGRSVLPALVGQFVTPEVVTVVAEFLDQVLGLAFLARRQFGAGFDCRRLVILVLRIVPDENDPVEAVDESLIETCVRFRHQPVDAPRSRHETRGPLIGIDRGVIRVHFHAHPGKPVEVIDHDGRSVRLVGSRKLTSVVVNVIE